MEISKFYKQSWKDYPFKQRLKFRLEAFGAYCGFYFLKLLGPKYAPKFCSSVLSFIGPHLPVSRPMMRNIARAMPARKGPDVERIIKGVWHNFGLMIGEFPFIQNFDTLDKSKVILEGWDEYFINRPNKDKGVIFFSCHTGNWEYISKVAEDRGIYPYRVFKAPSNPLVLPLFMKRVKAAEEEYLLPADKTAIIKCMRALRSGGVVALLTDQKTKGGEKIPFFGRIAATNGFIADLAIKNNVDILPCRTIRLDDGRLKVIVEPTLQYNDTENKTQTKINILTAMNRKIESWVREYPDQWFWLHKRWSRKD